MPWQLEPSACAGSPACVPAAELDLALALFVSESELDRCELELELKPAQPQIWVCMPVKVLLELGKVR